MKTKFAVVLLALVVGFVAYATSPPVLPDPLAAGWEGKKVCEKLHEDEQQRVLRCTFPPGVGHERHFHAKHFGYTLAGGTFRITEESGVREVTINESDYFASDGVSWHEVLNIGETTAVYLMFESK